MGNFMTVEQVRLGARAEESLVSHMLWDSLFQFSWRPRGSGLQVCITFFEEGHTFMATGIVEPLMSGSAIYFVCSKMIEALVNGYCDFFDRCFGI